MYKGSFNPDQAADLLAFLMQYNMSDLDLKEKLEEGLVEGSFSKKDLQRVVKILLSVSSERVLHFHYTSRHFAGKDEDFVRLYAADIRLQIMNDDYSHFNSLNRLLGYAAFSPTDEFISEIVGCSLEAVKRWRSKKS
jgi:hypothetical protein